VADTSGLPDLAARSLGGSVVWANDEFFAGRENLITPEPAGFSPRTFSAKGQVYDGWETRRRRDPLGRAPTDAYDEAIVRLGAPGVVRSVVVDTAHFTGNFPPDASVEATWLDGHPSVEELQAASWTSLMPRSRIEGDSENEFTVSSPQRLSHVRLRIYPDGGVARLRVRGEVVADPRLVEALGTVDLAALELGGRVTGCSNEHYGRPDRLISPGLARSMGEGWETARRRDAGHDWVQVRLACTQSWPASTGCRCGWPAKAWCGWSSSTRRGSWATLPAVLRSPPSVPPPPTRLSCCRRRRSSPTPGTGSSCPSPSRRARSGWTSSRTVAWRGCGCGGRRPTPG
jgi:allantoicase